MVQDKSSGAERDELLKAAVDGMHKAADEREQLEKAKDDLARAAYGVVDTAAGSRWLPEPSQLQGLRSLSAQTESIEELIIFIRYQIARSVIKREFEEPLIKQIQEIRTQATSSVMPRISLFLGYVYRYARYRRNQ